jgi:hypothetical protein
MNAQTKRPLASGKRVPCAPCSGTGLEVNGRYDEGRWVPILTGWACSTCKGRRIDLKTDIWEPVALEVAS